MTFVRLLRWALLAILIDLAAVTLLALLGIHYTA